MPEDARDPGPVDRTLAARLRDLCDHDLARLRGLAGAAYGLADALFLEAKQGGVVEPAHVGLRHVMEEAQEAVTALGERLHEAYELSREAPR